VSVSASARLKARQLTLQRRNAAIRKEFAESYTDAPRPRKYSREYVLAKLSEKHYLSIATIEDIVYKTEIVGTAQSAAPNGKKAGKAKKSDA